jgi:hypothetical protein
MSNPAKALACKAFKEKLVKGLQSSDSFLSSLNAIDDITWSIFMSNLQYNGNELAHADCTRLAEKLDRVQIAEVLANFGVSGEQFAHYYNRACFALDCQDVNNIYCDPGLCHPQDT